MAKIVIILVLPLLALIFLSMLLLIRRAEIAIDRLRGRIICAGKRKRFDSGVKPTVLR
jgi:hypothetical protein